MVVWKVDLWHAIMHLLGDLNYMAEFEDNWF